MKIFMQSKYVRWDDIDEGVSASLINSEEGKAIWGAKSNCPSCAIRRPKDKPGTRYCMVYCFPDNGKFMPNIPKL